MCGLKNYNETFYNHHEKQKFNLLYKGFHNHHSYVITKKKEKKKVSREIGLKQKIPMNFFVFVF